MNQTHKDALTLVLRLAQSYVDFPPAVDGEQEAVDTVQTMLDEANKVDVNPEPEPLISQVQGPVTVTEFLSAIKHHWTADLAVASELISFYRRGSGPFKVTNPNGSFRAGDFVTVWNRTYSIC